MRIEALQYEGGTIQSIIAALAATQLVRDLKTQLERLLDFVEAHN